MSYPQKAVVNTGSRFTHPTWKNGETVWVLEAKGDVCEIARKKNSEPEGTLRRDALQFEDES